MRSPKGFAAAHGLVAVVAVLGAVGLAGCTASSGFPAASAPGTPAPAARSASPRAATSTAPPPAPVSAGLRAGAQATAAHTLGMYAAGQFAAFWQLLSPVTKQRISSDAWVGVHQACPAAGAGTAVTIKAVTVLGDAAIVTEATGAAAHTAEVVFSYANGQWSYAPGDLSVYEHRSIAADVAAARAAGFCGGWKVF
jgi:hypothetical protein